MRTLLPLVLATSIVAAAEPQAQPASGKPAPAALQVLIDQANRQDANVWRDYDIDGDGRPSQVEILACLAKRAAWTRERFPELFATIDTDGDRSVSAQELIRFADRANSIRFAVDERTAAKHLRDLSSQQGFEDRQLASRFDPVIGVLTAPYEIEAGAVIIRIIR
jgi:calcium-binding protein CML